MNIRAVDSLLVLLLAGVPKGAGGPVPRPGRLRSGPTGILRLPAASF